MTIDTIVEGISSAPLPDDVKKAAIGEIGINSQDFKSFYTTLNYQPPTRHREIYEMITARAMGAISPMLEEAGVSQKDGTNTWAHIYASVSGENVQDYLEN